MPIKKTTSNNYIPFIGFYDLRAFDIPNKDFQRMYNVQEFLYTCEEYRKKGKYKDNPNELEKIKNLSAEYQRLLFSYPITKPELI